MARLPAGHWHSSVAGDVDEVGLATRPSALAVEFIGGTKAWMPASSQALTSGPWKQLRGRAGKKCTDAIGLPSIFLEPALTCRLAERERTEILKL